MSVEVNGCDGGKRRRIKISSSEAASQRTEIRGLQISEEEIGAFGAKFATPKQTADVDVSILHLAQPDVSVGAQMKFQVTDKRETARVDFEPKPRRWGTTAARGEDPPVRRVAKIDPRVGAKLATGIDKRSRETGIEQKPAQSPRGRRQAFLARDLFIDKPRDFVVKQSSLQTRLESEAHDRSSRKTGNEFPANAMTRVVTGFE
jgi:hypothetical protein